MSNTRLRLEYLPGHVTIYPIHPNHIPKFNVDVPLHVRPVICHRKPALVQDIQAHPKPYLATLRRQIGKNVDPVILSIVSAFLGDVRFFQKYPADFTELLIKMYLATPVLTPAAIAKEQYPTNFFCVQGLGNISMYCKSGSNSPGDGKVDEGIEFTPSMNIIKQHANALSERLWQERECYVQDIHAYSAAVFLLGLASCAPPPDIPSHLLQTCGYYWLHPSESHTMHTLVATAVSNALYGDNQSHTPLHLEKQVFECTGGQAKPFAEAAKLHVANPLCRGPHFQWTVHMVMVLSSHDDKDVCRCAAVHTDPTSLLLVELRESGFIKILVKAAVEEFKANGDSVRDGTIRSLGTVLNSLTNYCLVHDMYECLEDGLMELLKKCIVGRTVTQDLVPYELILQNMITYVRRNPLIARIVSKRIPKLQNLKGFYFKQTKEYWIVLSEITDAMKSIRKHCANPDCPQGDLSDDGWEKVATKACASCKSVYYCCRECQAIDWKVHKVLCYCWRRERSAGSRDTVIPDRDSE